jgi:plastocyanin
MRTLTLIAALLALAVAGCGGDDDDSGNGGGGGGAAQTETGGATEAETTGGGGGGGQAQTLRISADPGGALKFDKDTLTAKPGKVTIVMDNPSDLPHAVELEGHGIESEGETVGMGGVSRASGTVEAGEYEYYCPVDGHDAAGMTGTLTVR